MKGKQMQEVEKEGRREGGREGVLREEVKEGNLMEEGRGEGREAKRD